MIYITIYIKTLIKRKSFFSLFIHLFILHKHFSYFMTKHNRSILFQIFPHFIHARNPHCSLHCAISPVSYLSEKFHQHQKFIQKFYRFEKINLLNAFFENWSVNKHEKYLKRVSYSTNVKDDIDSRILLNVFSVL